MSAGDRLTRLRALVARLDQLPVSERREWMLSEARARMVDVETGERPRAMRPRVERAPAAAPPPTRRTAESRPQAAPDLPAVSEAATPVEVGDQPPIASAEESAIALGIDGVLSLEDSPVDDLISAVEGDGDATSAPWRRGLRG